ncbi:hypothetical protein EDB92DRAFT_1831457 [Lactarius akahatsu]|uniref:Uncharacterized protein n=1 Tax=Lactarius akahatsu TaxID=416441 RepID=A0AAD4LV00_9AGAM|nr:hypothetical protein EDB92DRAFT_1831457 [Lactarius akahatsu]
MRQGTWRLALSTPPATLANVLGIWPPSGISPHCYLLCHVKQCRGSAIASQLPRFSPDRPKQGPKIAGRRGDRGIVEVEKRV